MTKCKRSLYNWTALVAAASAVSLPSMVRADTPIVQFTPGDYLVMRGGDVNNSDGETGADFGGEVNTYIDEYSQSGYYVGTLAVPEMTLPGANASSHEGNLDISPNGQWIAFAGYDPVQNPPGTTPHNTDGTENALLGEVNLLSGPASLNASTVISGSENFPNSLTGQYVHAALTINGSEFYVGGKYNETAGGNLQTNDTGLLYVNGTGTFATTTVLEGGTDWRNILVYNGQLYGGTGSSSVGTHGAYMIGTGLPTSNNPIPAHAELTDYPGGQSASSLAFADITTSDSSAGVFNGYNVLYTIGDQSVSGIAKYYYDSATKTWNDAGLEVALTGNNNIVNPTGLVATVDPTNPAWVDITISGNNGVYSYIDKSGDPEIALTNNAFSQSVTPPSYASFYGMTQDPGPVNLVWGNAGNGQTWNVGAATNWTYAGASVAFANQENVTFDDTSNNTAPITLSSVVQPGSITVNASENNYTISGTGSIGGTGVLRLLPGNTSTFTLDTANTYSGGTIVDGGTLVIGAAGALPANGSLTINGGTTKLAAGTGQSSLSSLAISGTGVLDITDNSVAINYASGHSPAAAIRGLLTTGYDNDTWKGPGIDSSAAALNPGLFAIGYADGTVDAGTAAVKNQVLIEYTLAGDANLDGTVNFADLLVVAQNFNHVVDTHGNPIDWADGDFNYDGVVNFADLLLVAQNFNKKLSSGQLEQLPGSFSTEWNLALADVAAAQSNNVPEPGTVSLMALGGFALLRRRRK